MGIRNYLIEGISGSGKTSVAEALERRGYRVIHGDRALAYYGDPATGAPLDWPVFESEADRIAWGNKHWIWPAERVRALIADRRDAMIFFCGGSRNHQHFIDLFDAVFVLEVDVETLKRRLARRPEDEFGGRPVEQALVVQLHASGEDLPSGGIAIDATAPLELVVDAILLRCGAAGRQ